MGALGKRAIECMLFWLILLSASFWHAHSESSGLFAYIPNYDDNTVSVIDLVTNTVTTTIPAGNAPFAVATSPLNKVYITNALENSVSVLDAATNSVMSTILLDTTGLPNQSGIAVGPNGSRIYAAYNRTSTSSLAVIDGATDSIIDTVDVGRNPFGVVVNPTGTRVYVVNRYFAEDLSYGTVVVIDTTAHNTVITNIPVGNDPLGIAINPAGTKVYAVGDAGYVSVIDTQSNTVDGIIFVGVAPWGIAVSPDGSRLYVANRVVPGVCCNGTVSVIDTATNNVVATVGVGFGPVGISVTPDNSKIYVANQTSGNLGTVSVIDASTNTVVSTIPVGHGPFAFGRFILAPDTTPPVITPYVTGSSGNNGWYISDVNVVWEVQDPESTITLTSGCEPTSITSDTIGITLTCTATSVGGTASKSFTIKRDATPPTLTCSFSPNRLWPPDGSMISVHASVIVSDATSGPAGFVLQAHTSNEPGEQSDITGFVVGTSSVDGLVRAQRLGTGTGRIYTFTYRGTDMAGNVAACSPTILVPHDEGTP
jgi:YVTN family beta-propeller protein